ncbi:MAG: hypothetical protein ACTSSH_10165, partial [Candidatus Heimdallarchaeota archaeon]
MERTEYNNQPEKNRSGLHQFVDGIHRRPAERTIKKPLGKTNCYVIGVGGGGNNTINRLMSTGVKDVFCLCVNTDLQHLNSVKCDST